MDKQIVQDVINDLAAARRLAANAAIARDDYQANTYCKAYFSGRADALYEAIAVLESLL